MPRFQIRAHVDWTDYRDYEIEAEDQDEAESIAAEMMIQEINRDHPTLSNFEITTEIEDGEWIAETKHEINILSPFITLSKSNT